MGISYKEKINLHADEGRFGIKKQLSFTSGRLIIYKVEMFREVRQIFERNFE